VTISQVASQADGVTQDAAAGVTRAFPGNVTAGNLVYVGCAKYDTGVSFTAGNCTKSAGTATIGTPTLDVVVQVGNIAFGVWSAIVTGTGSLTLQIASTAGTYFALGSDELASTVGWDAARAEASNTGSGNSVTQITGNITSAGAAAFVGGVALDASANVADFTEQAAFTRIYLETDASLHEPGLTMLRIVASGTTDAIESSTSSGARTYVAAGVAYKESGGAAAAPDESASDSPPMEPQTNPLTVAVW
jgi:hypothetical protein